MSRRHDEDLIQAAFEHTLDARRFAELEQRLRHDPELRRTYLGYARLDCVLAEKFASSEPAPSSPASGRRPARRGPWLALAACAALLAAAIPLLPHSEPGASVEFGPESHGRIVHTRGKAAPDTLRPGSRVELEHGSASIRFPEGGRAYFEGPGSLELVAEDRFSLHEGRVWFDSGCTSLGCLAGGLDVESRDGEFGLIAADGHELHAIRGELSIRTPAGATDRLAAGRSVRWDGASLEPADATLPFTNDFPRSVTLFAEDFSEPDLTPLSGKRPDQGPGPWQVEYGGPLIEDGVLDTSGDVRHMAFAPLGGPALDELSHILLLTLETEAPATSRFHSEGWAGVSLYTGDQERIFVGDPCGPAEGWALHPAGYSARHACPLLRGKSTVTLRYDFRSGLAQLFEGTDTTGPALASEWIAPGLQFDRIRIANGSQADAAVDAGKPPAAAGDDADARVRGDIALRRIRLTVLDSESRSAAGQP